MKNLIPSLLFLVILTGLKAQMVTYTASDYGVAGDSLYYSHVTDSVPQLNYGQAGANVSWNFSTLVPTTQSTEDYLNPLTAGYYRPFLTECVAGGRGLAACAGTFSELTNLAFRQLGTYQVSTIAFANAVENDFISVPDNSLTTNILGLTTTVGGVPIPFTTTYIQPDRVILFPIAYGNADSSKSSYDINLTPYGIDFIYHAHGNRVNHVDAWGSLTTPYATYSSTVREYSVVVHNDTVIYNHTVIPIPVSTTFEYAWYNPSYVGPVFTASGNIYGNQKIYNNVSYLATPVCLTPRAVERHEPFSPVIKLPGNVVVNFTNFSIDADAYYWNFGDPASGSANTSGATNPTHIYSDTGVFNLTLVACNTVCTPEICDTLPFIIDVRDSGQVRADFFADPTLVCTGQEVHFINLSANATSYLWNFGDLNTSTATSPTHAYTTAGTYTATLIAYNGASSDTERVAITVEELPDPVIHVSGPTTFCNGDSVTLYGSGGTIYHWSTGQLASQIVVKRSGIYTVTATNNCGSRNSAPVTITVNTPTDTLVALGDTIFCQGDSVTLQANTGNGLLYRWRRNGQIILGASDDYYNASVSGFYEVNVTEDNCIGVSNLIEVIANVTPVASISTQGSTTICSGTSLIITAAPGVGNTYQWQLNGQDIQGATDATYSASLPGTYTAIVSRNRCSATSNSIIVTVNTTPSPVITYQGAPVICSGDSLIFNATTGNGFTYQWLNNGEPITGAISDYYYASSSASYTVMATANGCSATSPAVSLLVNPSPAANAGVNQNLTGCSFSTDTLGGNPDNPTASGGTSPYTILWSPTSGLNDSALANPIVSQLGGTTTYRVLVTDANGCTATSVATITVTGSNLTVVISAMGDSTWCTGTNSNVTLTANPAGSPGPFTYTWSPSTGLSTTSEATTIASPTDAGTYNYTVQVVNSSGCQASSGYTVEVIALPTAIITPLDTTAPCQGDSVQIAANPGAGYTYQWLNNSEPVSGSTDINYTTTSSGSYSVSVTSGICSAVSNTVAVTVRPNPSSTINAAGSTSICEGNNVSLEAATGANYTYQWYENDYGIANATASTYAAGDSASYYYIVGLNGCFEQSDSIFVTVNQYPLDSVAINGPNQFCAGGVTSLLASTGAGYTYQWQDSGQAIEGAVSSTYGADSTGLYTVAVTALGCTSTSLGIDITVYPYPTASIMGETSTNFCAGDSVTLIASSGPGYTYQWYVDGDTINGALDTTFVANDTGSYNVLVTQNGCTSTSNALYVNVLPLPFAYATVANNGYICPGDSTVIYASTGSGYSYQWQIYGTSIGNATADSLIVSAPDIYDVIVTAAGCVTPSNYVPIAYDTLPAITLSGDTLYASGGYNYQWYQDSTTIIPGATSQFYLPQANGTYNVMVTDSINCTQESASFSFTTGINPVSEIANISIYPNPAHDVMNVVLNSPSTVNVALKLYDILGNEVKDVYEGKTTVGNNYYIVPVSILPQGIYMLTIYDGQNTVTQKLVKE